MCVINIRNGLLCGLESERHFKVVIKCNNHMIIFTDSRQNLPQQHTPTNFPTFWIMLNIVLIVIHQSIRDYEYDRARPTFQRILLTMNNVHRFRSDIQQ